MKTIKVKKENYFDYSTGKPPVEQRRSWDFEGHNKVCKLQEKCEEVTEKTKDFKEKTLKPTEEIPDDKGEQVKKRIKNSNHRFQKVKLNSKNINLCLLLQRWRKEPQEKKVEKELKEDSDKDELNDLKITRKQKY